MFLKGEGMQFHHIKWIFLLAAFVPLLTVASDNGDVAKGKEVYKRCSVCHGADGEGNEAMAKMLKVTIPAMGSKQVQSLDDAALKKIILEGKGKMQAVKLSDQELNDVIAFLRSLKE
jgi:mono/diheme cytochrome c family protein